MVSLPRSSSISGVMPGSSIFDDFNTQATLNRQSPRAGKDAKHDRWGLWLWHFITMQRAEEGLDPNGAVA